MKEQILKATKVAAGIGVGVIAAEVVAIGANAAFDDIGVIKDSIVHHFNPEPPKKVGFFKKFKKGGK